MLVITHIQWIEDAENMYLTINLSHIKIFAEAFCLIGDNNGNRNCLFVTSIAR